MPYNTTAIPPRKEPTGTTQLPLSKVKKMIARDPDIAICSNNAAFLITLATEMFIQHLAEDAHTQAKLERKPRRNVQYKDVANAVAHQDNLEFLEDMVPKTVPYKKAKSSSGLVQSRLGGDRASGAGNTTEVPHRPSSSSRPQTANGGATPIKTMLVNGDSDFGVVAPRSALADTSSSSLLAGHEDPNDQLELEMRQAAGARDGDVDMTG